MPTKRLFAAAALAGALLTSLPLFAEPLETPSNASAALAPNLMGQLAVFAPAATPQPVLARINQEVSRLQKDPEFLARLAAIGFEPLGGDLPRVRKYLGDEFGKWVRVVEKTGARIN